MSERNPELTHEHEQIEKPNLLKDFERCIDVVVSVDSEWMSNLGPRDRDIIRYQMGAALDDLTRRRNNVPKEEMKIFEKSSVTGFQGISGANRYRVRGDGSIQLLQSHSIDACIKKAQELGLEISEY